MGRGHSPEAYRGRLRPGVLLGAAHQLIVPICRSATALARFVASVVAGVVMTVGALEAQPQIPSVTDPNRDAGRAGSEVLAVVPFVNISGDPADDWIGSGITADRRGRCHTYRLCRSATETPDRRIRAAGRAKFAGDSR